MNKTILQEIYTKFNECFDKQKFLDWLRDNKKELLEKEKNQIVGAFGSGMEEAEAYWYDKQFQYKENGDVFYKTVYK